VVIASSLSSGLIFYIAEKRAAAQKAEIDFFALLKESGVAKPGAVWKDVRDLLAVRIY
jgi:hypothetical protein